MRLINADTVDLPLCDWYPTREIKDLLNRQTTAYDVDKVVEQLEKGIDPNVDCDTGEPCNNWAVDMQNKLIMEHIAIVKGGGVNE